MVGLETLKPTGSPKNGFGTWSFTRTSEREISRIELIDVQRDVVVRCRRDRDRRRSRPTYSKPTAMLSAELTGLTSTEYWCTFGAVLVLIGERDLRTDVGQRRRANCQSAAATRVGYGSVKRDGGAELPLPDQRFLVEADLAVVGGVGRRARFEAPSKSHSRRESTVRRIERNTRRRHAATSSPRADCPDSCSRR